MNTFQPQRDAARSIQAEIAPGTPVSKPVPGIADPNTAKVFYVAVGTGRAMKNYGPFPFKNPLAP